MAERGRRHIAVIGAGLSGLCVGIQLKRAGIHDFTIYEQAGRLGGTWRDNVYPGAACDTPSFAYCFSFAQKLDWSRKWAGQAEILGYLDGCADAFGLRPHLRLGTRITSGRFDAATGRWQLHTSDGEVLEADVLVSGVGQLARPRIPPFPGLERFGGERFHSARWKPGCELAGRRVAVVGNAASAVQLVPEVARRCAHLSVFQRSANWMLPRGDRPFRAGERRAFSRLPWLARLYRWAIWASFELRFPVFRRNAFLARRAERVALRWLDHQVADPGLRRALRPDYAIGGKRILISDDYYRALQRENVELVTRPIERFGESGVVTADGREHPVDVAIFATGFEASGFPQPFPLEGLRGRTLAEAWQGGARSYLGLQVAGFPNFFLMYGPNTNLGHNSIVFMIECQARYVVDAVRQLLDRDLAWVDVRAEVEDAFQARLERELLGSVWATTGKSWYKDDSGRITHNWSGTTVRYWWRTRRADLGRCHCVPRAALTQQTPQPAPEPARAVH